MKVRRTVRAEVDLGTAELVPDRRRPAGWTLYVDGVEQSYVDTARPGRLEFEYMRRIATVVDAAGPAGEPIRVLHLGGGAMTLPRYVAATRPGSVQDVVERDARLVELVQRFLPFTGARIHVADAVSFVAGAAKGAYDLVVGDVFRGAVAPAAIGTVDFVGQVRRTLAPAGLYVVNLTDLPPLAHTRTTAAVLASVFRRVCLIGSPKMLRSRRYGNLILVGTDGELPTRLLTAAAARDPAGGRVLTGPGLTAFLGPT